ncbi:hypothetical protein [Streptomyces sp. NPDC059979]|uniref:hypothetical protein n=1 Tax=Streptomyces sp. NPDC059979 TaxID=3347021 RepID=UPI0036B4818C
MGSVDGTQGPALVAEAGSGQGDAGMGQGGVEGVGAVRPCAGARFGSGESVGVPATLSGEHGGVPPSLVLDLTVSGEPCEGDGLLQVALSLSQPTGVDGREHGEGREGGSDRVETGADPLTGGTVLLEADGAGGEVGSALLEDWSAALLVVQEPQLGQQAA